MPRKNAADAITTISSSKDATNSTDTADATAADSTVAVATEEEAAETVEVEVEAEVETVEETEEVTAATESVSHPSVKEKVDRVGVAESVGSKKSETVQGGSSGGAVSDATQPAAVPTIYTLTGASFEKGVTLYHIQMTDGRNLQWAAPVRKRYTEFSQMYAKLQASSLLHCKSLPTLPSKGGVITFLRSRQNKKVVDDRERKFTAILEFISRHRELANSSVFQSFVGQRS